VARHCASHFQCCSTLSQCQPQFHCLNVSRQHRCGLVRCYNLILLSEYITVGARVCVVPHPNNCNQWRYSKWSYTLGGRYWCIPITVHSFVLIYFNCSPFSLDGISTSLFRLNSLACIMSIFLGWPSSSKTNIHLPARSAACILMKHFCNISTPYPIHGEEGTVPTFQFGGNTALYELPKHHICNPCCVNQPLWLQQSQLHSSSSAPSADNNIKNSCFSWQQRGGYECSSIHQLLTAFVPARPRSCQTLS